MERNHAMMFVMFMLTALALMVSNPVRVTLPRGAAGWTEYLTDPSSEAMAEYLFAMAAG
jgi:hypothetical protein